jgi:redox-regulated HSP33 family molecular chaperone
VSDQLQKFMFNSAPVRGEIVSLRNTWQEVLTRRDYPAPVRTVLGEMMAACALLSANLKVHGTLIMQIFGDGPVQMLVVQCSSDLSMRATAKFAGEASTIGDDLAFASLVNASGHGRCVITLDPADKLPGQQPYQGIVPLNGVDGPLESVSQVLEHYMHHSEQLDTRLWLAADRDRAVGMLLQKLPATAASCRAMPRPTPTRGSASVRSAARCRRRSCSKSSRRSCSGASSGRRTCSTSSRPARASSARARAKRSVRCCACWAATKSTA